MLQVHIQTIGILVAEKTELQSHLAQAQKIGEQRLGTVLWQLGKLSHKILQILKIIHTKKIFKTTKNLQIYSITMQILIG